MAGSAMPSGASPDDAAIMSGNAMVDTIISATMSVAPKREGSHLSNEEKLRVCAFSQENPTMSQKELSAWAQRTFGLDKAPCQATISNILKKRALLQSMNAAELMCKRRRVLKYPEIDRALGNWVLYCLHKGLRVSGELIKKQAAVFAELLHPPDTVDMSFSNGWLEGFQARYGIKKLKKAAPQQSTAALYQHQQAAVGAPLGSGTPQLPLAPPSTDDAPILATPFADFYSLAELQVLVATYHPADVYHMDEVGLFYDLPLEQHLWVAQRTGGTAPPASLTIALAVNADASDLVEPFFVGKALRPACFKDKLASERGFQYDHNKKGVMSVLLFQRWLRAFDNRMRSECRNVVLIVDSAPSHVVVGLELTSVRVAFLSPKGSVKLQPLNGGITKAFKRRYRRAQLVNALDRQEQCRREIFVVTQLEAMQWSKQCWQEISPELVQTCWRATKIFGGELLTPAEKRRHKLEDEVEDDIYKHIQWLRIAEPMALDDMLSPEGENDVHAGVSVDDFVNCAIELEFEPSVDAGVTDLLDQQTQMQLPQQVPEDVPDAFPMTNEEKLEHLSYAIRILNEHGALESSKHELRMVQRSIRDLIVEQRRLNRR